jgi:thiosulfate/3-mercaptopyruvate sulfurtransferase
MSIKSSRRMFLQCLLVLPSLSLRALDAQQIAATTGNGSIPSGDLLQPAELTKLLHDPGEDRPLLLQTGSHTLYAEAHIPGSEYVGAAGNGEGLTALENHVKSLDRHQFVVLYCGCCAWDRCPNIRPAYQQLHALGFTRLKVLYLAENFGTDWVDKGYPVARGR